LDRNRNKKSKAGNNRSIKRIGLVALLDPPQEDEIEVSVFGPRRGYGESIVIHIGGGQWIIVDSCNSEVDSKPAPLIYLEALGVDVSKSVSLVVASHWHSDHIDGLGVIFDRCEQAEFVCSNAVQMEELIELNQAYNRHPPSKNKHGLEELNQIISILRNRSPATRYKHLSSPKWAISQRSLLRCEVSYGVECNVTALSPSDASILKAKREIASLAEDYLKGSKRNIVVRGPNHNAVVLWIQVGNHNILLGSDLEETKDPGTGWNVILSDFNPGDDKADVYKVSHHGSKTGDNSGIWEKLLNENPHAILTPFINGGVKLPQDKDVSRIKTRTKYCYSTSISHLKHRKLTCNTKLLVKSATRVFYSCDNTIGHVRARTKISNDPVSSNWSVDLDKQSAQL
jgi:beta-lactamase superfamily II metal-dependent hydrolase